MGADYVALTGSRGDSAAASCDAQSLAAGKGPKMRCALAHGYKSINDAYLQTRSGLKYTSRTFLGPQGQTRVQADFFF